jgi:hypothetical protein
MTSLYNDLLDFLFFCILVACIFLNLFISFLLEVSYRVFFLFFDNIHGLPFHFYSYNAREEDACYFENFDKSFFVFCLLQFCHPILNYFLAMLMGLPLIFACILWERKTQIWRNTLGKKVTKQTLQAWDWNFHKVSFLSIYSCLFFFFMVRYLQLGFFFGI